MRILVDASAAFEQGAGIGRYSRELLTRVVPSMPDTDWTLFRTRDGVSESYLERDAFAGQPVRTVTAPFTRRRADQLWHRLRLPVDVRLLAGGASLVYSPDFTAPSAYGLPRIVTIHDLAFLTHPRHTTPALQRYLGRVVPREIRRASHVITVSRATKADVESLLHVSPSKVSIVRNGVGRHFLDAAPLSPQQRTRMRLPSSYMLMVGTIEPRKNHDAVLRILGRLNQTLLVPLVIAGRAGWGCDATLIAARKHEREGRVIMLDYVPEVDLPSLMASASVLIYPSWTEGFGLPVIEALATGTPVVTGNASALREAGGDVARFVDPARDDELLAAIERELERAQTPELRMERRRWASRFDWDASALALRDVLHAVGGRADA